MQRHGKQTGTTVRKYRTSQEEKCEYFLRILQCERILLLKFLI